MAYYLKIKTTIENKKLCNELEKLFDSLVVPIISFS
jgi:hypothetical protein